MHYLRNAVMMRTELIGRFFFLLCLLVILTSAAFAQGITVSQSVDRTNIPYEETVTIDISLTWQGSQFLYRFDKPLSPELDRLKVKGYSTTISSSGSGDGETTTKQFKLTLTPTSAGVGTISPITISYLKWPDSLPGEVVTEAMTVNIADPAPVKSDEGLRLVDWVKVVAAVLVPITIFLVVRRRQKRIKDAALSITPKERFLAELTTLKADSGTDLKKFLTGLYKLLSDYLTDRYYFDAERISNEEVDALMSQTDLSEAQRAKLGQWLGRARADRFRPVTAEPGEVVRLESEIRQFFEQLSK